MPYEPLTQLRGTRKVVGRLLNLPTTGILIFSLLMLCVGYGIMSMPVRAATRTEILWGISQACDSDISNPENSINGASAGFDGKSASCVFSANQTRPAWTMNRFERPTADQVSQVRLEIGFFVSGWNQQDVLVLQASNNNGKTWVDLEKYDRTNPAPAKLANQEIDTANLFASRAGLRKAQVRLIYTDRDPGTESLVVNLDEMRLVGIGEMIVPTPTLTDTQPPTATDGPPDPTNTPQESTDNNPSPTTTPTISVTLPMESADITYTPTPQLTPVILTPTLKESLPATLVPSVTLTATITITPTPLPTSQPVVNNIGRGQVLWAVNQSCNFPIIHPENSLDQNFNDQVASCSGQFAGQQAGWQLLAFQHTSFTHIDDIRLDLRLSVSGWIDDRIDLEVFDGAQWQKLDQFDLGHTVPPAGIANLSYPLINILQSPETVNQVKVRLVGVQANQTADPITVNMDGARLVVSGGDASLQAVSPISTPSSLRLAAAAASTSGDPHGDFTITTDSCAGCHRSHSGQGNLLRENWPEEMVCFGCHSTGGPGTSVQPAFTNNLNSATGYYSHPVSSTTNVHHRDESTGGSFGAGNRHVECEDCHEPHSAGRGSSQAPALQAEMNAVSGADPVWTGSGGPASFTWLTAATREYQVCFKCHSSFTGLPTYAPDGWNGTAIVANGLRKLTGGNAQQVVDSRDMAREFNPYQASFHPVAAPGRNTNISANSFVNGWNQNSMVYCSDCHTNAAPASGATGPHGSPLLHLLSGSSNYSTVMRDKAPRVPSTQICFNCHNYSTYVTGQDQSTHFRFHEKHMNNDWGTTCYTCHDSHGSEQLHLINFDASVMTFPSGRNSQTAWYYDPVNQTAGCFLSCHGKNHDPFVYRP